MEVLSRFDIYDMAMPTTIATINQDGSMSARCAVTNVGVFSYRNADGSVRRELRMPEEVFNADSIESLKGVPLTNLHHGLVTESNVDELKIGELGNEITQDAYHLFADVTIRDAETIAAVKNREKTGLSCGYTCRLDWQSGNWMGVHYDCIQRDIRYNHCAVVPKGRAGDDARIRLDAADADDVGEFIQEQETTMAEKTYKEDAELTQKLADLETKMDEAIKGKDAEIAKLNEDMEAVKAQNSALEAERDSYKEKYDSAIAEQPELIKKAVAERLFLVAKAQGVGVEVKADMDDASIKVAVIKKAFPKAELEGKDEAYIAARLDCAFEMLSEEKGEEEEPSHRGDAADVPPATETEVKEDEEEEAKKRYIARLENGWKA